MVTMNKTIALICILTSVVFAKTDFDVSSAISQSKIYKNQTTTLTLSINGADKDLYKDIEQPNLSDMFSIISTSQSSSFSYVNGKVNRNKQYRYELKPIKSGIFIIDPFKVTFNGKMYSTKPLRVVVRNANAKLPTTQPNSSQAASNQPMNQTITATETSRPNRKLNNIFLEADISTNNIYIGESIDYSVKLFRRIRLWSSISIEQNDIQNVWQESFETKPEQVVRKNGTRYYELELTKKTIRPLSDGILEIPPLISRFMVDPFSGENQLSTDVVTVNVMTLPEPIPQSFTGAIGMFQMNVAPPVLNEESNSLQVQVTITGTGNITAIKAPLIQDTAEYRVLSAPKNENMNNKRVFDYVIIPKVTGSLEIPPIEFSYFSKENSDYVKIESSPIIFNATLESMNPTKTSFNAQNDIQFLAANSMINRFISMLNNQILILSLITLNTILLTGLLIRVISKKVKKTSNGQQRSKRKILQNVQQLSEKNSINEMELVLIDVLSYFTDYKQKSIHPKDVEGSLIKAHVSDPIVKSTMQWIKNTQLIRFSNEKENDAFHSNSESLKRILKHIILEREKK